MQIVNLNVRVCTNGAIFVQYSKGGKALDAAFIDWQGFISWLSLEASQDC